eukprot:9751506-Lingulodinium_polyedra.AAC.1
MGCFGRGEANVTIMIASKDHWSQHARGEQRTPFKEQSSGKVERAVPVVVLWYNDNGKQSRATT